MDVICAQAGSHRLYFQRRPVASDPDVDKLVAMLANEGIGDGGGVQDRGARGEEVEIVSY